MEKLNNSFRFYRKIRHITDFVIEQKCHPSIIGRENIPVDSACILAGNHKSMWDILLLAYAADTNLHFIAKSELFFPIIGEWFFKKLQTIAVNRDGHDIASYRAALHVLKNGEKIAIFPEGTRDYGKELLPFKSGPTALAIQSASPIIPFGITGDYCKRGNCCITFGEPLVFGKDDRKIADGILYENVKKLIR